MADEDETRRRIYDYRRISAYGLTTEERALFRAYAERAAGPAIDARAQALATLIEEFIELQVRSHPGDDPVTLRGALRAALDENLVFRDVLAILGESGIQA